MYLNKDIFVNLNYKLKNYTYFKIIIIGCKQIVACMKLVMAFTKF